MKLTILAVLSLILLLAMVLASPILFTSPTPVNATSTLNTTVLVNTSFSTTNSLDTFIFNWNATNYTIFNSSLVLFFGMNNFSSLGENDTFVVDSSSYSNNGTLINGSVVSGAYGNGVQFLNNATLNLSKPASLDVFQGQFTIDFWIYPINYTNNLFPRIFEKRSHLMAIMGDPVNARLGQISMELANASGSNLVDFILLGTALPMVFLQRITAI